MNLKVIKQPDGSVDLIGVQGKTWDIKLTLKQPDGTPIDVSSWTVRGQIRKTYKAANVTATWSCSILNGPGGEILVTMPAIDSAKIPCGDSVDDLMSKYVYDIEAEDSNSYVLELMRGRLFVLPEVTK